MKGCLQDLADQLSRICKQTDCLIYSLKTYEFDEQMGQFLTLGLLVLIPGHEILCYLRHDGDQVRSNDGHLTCYIVVHNLEER